MTLRPAISTVVVDDEIEIASVFRRFLQNEGYNTLSFTDPALAYEYFKETKATPSLLITDMKMPGLDGIELARRVREIDKDIKIFLMTAFEVSGLEDQPSYKEAKIDKLLQKPIHFYELRNMINDTLRTNG